MTENSVNTKIGAQIRMYRKMAKISIEEMSHTIGKSRATVSKYETGAIAIDVSTLFEIASALNIGVSCLIDITTGEKEAEKIKSPLGSVDHFYLYQRVHKKTFCSYIHLGQDEIKGEVYATFYYKPDNIKDHQNCEGVYRGTMNSRDNMVTFLLQNLYCEAETAYISFFLPMKKLTAIPGILTGMDTYSMRPTSIKVILSKDLLTGAELDALFIVSKEQIKRLKEDNCFIVDL